MIKNFTGFLGSQQAIVLIVGAMFSVLIMSLLIMGSVPSGYADPVQGPPVSPKWKVADYAYPVLPLNKISDIKQPETHDIVPLPPKDSNPNSAIAANNRSVVGSVSKPLVKSSESQVHVVKAKTSTMTVTAGQSIQLSAAAFDRHGVEIEDVGPTWRVLSPLYGSIDADGLFTAGLKSGNFRDAISAFVLNGDIEVEDLIDLNVVPHTLDTGFITPGSITLFTGGAQEFSVEGKDVFGNPVPLTISEWVTEGGEIESDGVFRAGTIPGEFKVSAFVRSLAHPTNTIEVHTDVKLEHGTCRLEDTESRWEFQVTDFHGVSPNKKSLLSVLEADGNFHITNEHFPDLDLTEPGATLNGNITIVVPTGGLQDFLIGAEGGYWLLVDGVLVAASLASDTYSQQTISIELDPGEHDIEIGYYQRDETFDLKFHTDEDLVHWKSVSQCTGMYSPLKVDGHFLYGQNYADPGVISDRFRVEAHDVMPIDSDQGIWLVNPSVSDPMPAGVDGKGGDKSDVQGEPAAM